MNATGKIFELRDGSFMLVTDYGSRPNSVGLESRLFEGPTTDPRQDHKVYMSWEYTDGFPREAARYVPPTIRKELESFEHTPRVRWEEESREWGEV
mgnify:CR=1 FL=1